MAVTAPPGRSTVGAVTLRADPAVVQPHEGLTIELGYTRLRVVLSGEDTRGAFAMTEQPLEAGALAGPLHTHADQDGFIFVLAGRLGAQVGDRVVEVGERGTVVVQRGVKHTFWNPTKEDAVALELFAPAGLERWFEDLARLVAVDPPDLDAILASARTHGTELDLASLPDLLDQHGLHLPVLQPRAEA
jgi:mannose-6-phosphate isomerase-like protein (cupin superfamily)